MKNEEKELYEIAKIAYFETTSACESDWKAVAQAVIAEHKRRKAIERNAPKTVASASMVPPHKFALPPMHDTEQVKPDPFAAEKAAFAQGKTIQYFSKSSDEWLDCDLCPPNCLPSWLPNYEYRVKPEPVPYADKSSGQIVDLVESILKILKSQQP